MDNEVIQEIRIALGSVAPIPLRCKRTEDVLRGQRPAAGAVSIARRELEREIAPIDDIRSTRDYRLLVSLNLLEDFLATL
jgi:carbon-monoxide dehydrogenase medium subunit